MDRSRSRAIGTALVAVQVALIDQTLRHRRTEATAATTAVEPLEAIVPPQVIQAPVRWDPASRTVKS